MTNQPMKKSELEQLIREEISKSLNEASSSPQPVYDNLLDAYRKMEEWLTENVSTKQSVEIERAFSIGFSKLQNTLLKNNRSNFSL